LDRTNLKVFNLSLNLLNDDVHDTVMNLTIQSFVDVDDITIFLKLAIPADDSDRKYSQEIMNTRVNCKSVLKGFNSNYVVKTFLDSVLKAIDFELKFPFKKVKK
jgi:hypothetical protein